MKAMVPWIALGLVVGFGLAVALQPVGQRFLPLGFEGTADVALDTKTGQLCRAHPDPEGPEPLCLDLYRQSFLRSTVFTFSALALILLAAVWLARRGSS